MLDEKLKSNNKFLDDIFTVMEDAQKQYICSCDMLKRALNKRFYGDIEGIVDDITYQASDGFVIVWGNFDNTPLRLEIIKELKTAKEFEKYLKENTI